MRIARRIQVRDIFAHIVNASLYYFSSCRGITIDLETEEGFTALIAAAEENVEAVNHDYMTNTDGTPCLQVAAILFIKNHPMNLNKLLLIYYYVSLLYCVFFYSSLLHGIMCHYLLHLLLYLIFL